tara:strand:+ start:1937 stop:2731 length:795 start_codon:yes stop_codon:yes gene_type:complete
MNSKKSIGFIGFGNMATAIFNGLQQNKNKISKIYACRKSKKALPKQLIALNHIDLIKKSDIIILAIKPQQVKEISVFFNKIDFSNKCILSIMAGTTISTLNKLNPSLNSIIRVMPNTAASIQESISFIANNKKCKKEFIHITEEIFSSIGKIQIIKEEQMNFATAMFGSGPAFIYQIMKELIKICKENNLQEKESELLIKQLFLSSSKMAHSSSKNISKLIDEICSPKGTTEAGLDKFKELNLDISLAQIIETAKNRSKKLSNE